MRDALWSGKLSVVYGHSYLLDDVNEEITIDPVGVLEVSCYNLQLRGAFRMHSVKEET